MPEKDFGSRSKQQTSDKRLEDFNEIKSLYKKYKSYSNKIRSRIGSSEELEMDKESANNLLQEIEKLKTEYRAKYQKHESAETIKPIEFYLNEIRENSESQPGNVQELIKYDLTGLLNEVKIVGDKTYIISNYYDGIAFAFVKENNSKNYQLVFFRKSGSDRQWKALPGYRADKGGYASGFKKGDERNPMHHYVQSAKLHPEILASLDNSTNFPANITFIIPTEGGRYSSDNTYSESYYEFKNPELANEFKSLVDNYRKYFNLIKITDSNKISVEERFELIYNLCPNQQVRERIKEIIDIPSIAEILKNSSFSNLRSLSKREGENQELLKELVSLVFNQTIYPETLKIFAESKTSFEPNFEYPPINAYKKEDINIEEYLVTTPEGDELVYSMANDSKGRVYIDNIYDKNSKITPYGTYENIVNAGMLVYKPEDYDIQTSHIPNEFKNREGKYDDISDVFYLIPVVKRYREALKSRGVFVRPLKSENFSWLTICFLSKLNYERD